MLSSKANAALARLKEIEEKYKMKRKEQKWKEDTDSSISSVSIVPSENPSESKKSPRKATKPKLDIKMPDTRFEEHGEETKLSSKNETLTSNKASVKSPEDAADLDVAMPLNDKSSHSAKNQESLISDTMTIQENSLIESVLDDSVIPSKSLSRSKTSRRNSSTVSDRSSGREEIPKTQTTRSKEGKEFNKSSEISKGKASPNNSSISKRLRSSGKSNEISRVRPGLKKHSLENKTITEMPKKTDSNVRDDSESLRDDSVVDDSIGTMENGSEIISELSRAEESFVTKIEHSVDVSEGSEHQTDENVTSVTVPNGSKSLMVENGYANDTFEDISSSTIRSQREEMINEKKEAVARAGTKAKKMDVAEYRSYQDNAEEHRDELVIAFDLPNATKVGPGPSNHVSDFESIIANPDNVTKRSIKLSQSVDLRLKNQRGRQHRKALFQDENVSNATSSNKKTSDFLESSTGDVTKTNEKKNSPGMTTVRQESGQKGSKEASNRTRERVMIDVIGLPVANDQGWIESAKSSSLEENEEEREDVLDESLAQRISQENVLRKSHKDSLAKRHVNSKTATKASESSSDNKSVSEVRSPSKTRKATREENKTCRYSEKNKISNHNFHEHDFKKRKKRAKITNLKSAGICNSTESRKEDKALRFGGKQTRGHRRRLVELRLRQEREDLQKYLHELKDLKLKLGSTRSYFRPLEFPKIAEFTQLDVNDLESKPDDQFRERVFAIKRWLKDQYVLYRDYCTMAQAINAHYVPTTLDDAKKTIRELRKTIKTR